MAVPSSFHLTEVATTISGACGSAPTEREASRSASRTPRSPKARRAWHPTAALPSCAAMAWPPVSGFVRPTARSGASPLVNKSSWRRRSRPMARAWRICRAPKQAAVLSRGRLPPAPEQLGQRAARWSSTPTATPSGSRGLRLATASPSPRARAAESMSQRSTAVGQTSPRPGTATSRGQRTARRSRSPNTTMPPRRTTATPTALVSALHPNRSRAPRSSSSLRRLRHPMSASPSNR